MNVPPASDYILQTIQACSDLQWATPDQQWHLAAKAHHRFLAAGDSLFHQGDRGESVFLLISGDLEVYLEKSEAEEDLILARLFRRGEVLGEWAATREEQSRSASVRARRDTTLLEIPYSLIREIGALTRFLGHSARRGEQLESHDALITESPLFSLMTRQGSARLNYREMTTPEGQRIFDYGDPSTEVFLILDGEIEILSDTDRLITTLAKGQIFGELGVTRSLPRSASARARKDSRLLVLEAGDFLSLARENPDFARHMVTLRKIYQTRLEEVVLQFQYHINGQPCFTSTLQLDEERQLISNFSVHIEAVSIEILPSTTEAIVFTYEDPSRNLVRRLELSAGVITGARFTGPHRETGLVVEAMRQQTVISADQLKQFEESGEIFTNTENSKLICHCMQIPRSEIADGMEACTLDELMQITGAGTVCGGCRGDLAQCCQPSGDQPMEILEVSEFQPGYCRVRFTPHGEEALSTFKAGQHIRLEASIQGQSVRRTYTLTSPAHETRWREITFKREPHGLFSRWLSGAKPGQTQVSVSPPEGEFAVDLQKVRPVILLVAGIGVTPALCIARSRAVLDQGPRIVINHSFHSLNSAPCEEELQKISAEHIDIDYQPLETLAGNRLKRQHLKEYHSSYPDAQWMICGPENYERAMQEHLKEIGVADDAISRELFHARGAQATASIPRDPLSLGLALVTTVITAVVLGWDLLPAGWKAWQQTFAGHWISGGTLLAFIGWQWILPLQRVQRSTGDSGRSLRLHRRIGAASPLLLLFHGHSYGAGILGLITGLFLIHTLLGVADRSLISDSMKQRRYLKLWLYPHIVVSILLSALALFHLWLIIGHGGP